MAFFDFLKPRWERERPISRKNTRLIASGLFDDEIQALVRHEKVYREKASPLAANLKKAAYWTMRDHLEEKIGKKARRAGASIGDIIEIQTAIHMIVLKEAA